VMSIWDQSQISWFNDRGKTKLNPHNFSLRNFYPLFLFARCNSLLSILVILQELRNLVQLLLHTGNSADAFI
jgi:hypothetical protein